ncbi:MAG: hypothetical protein E7327_05265 [Clostridiales bacterium]|nr:hypothetical protein [Clostridiales bacterium]
MKEYPRFTHGHGFIWIPSEERRSVSKQFHHLFSPTLKENGFVRKESAWWRILNGNYLQGINFDVSPQNKYVDDLVVEYTILPLYAGLRSSFCTTFLGNHHLLTKFLYPGYPDVDGTFTARLMDEDGLPGELVATSTNASCSFFNALHNSEEALKAELEIFCERTLPAMNLINSPESYLLFYNTLQHAPHAHISSENYIATQLLLGDWKEAERGIVAASHNGTNDIEKMTEMLTFPGSEDYISNLLGQASFSPDQRYGLVRDLLTMKYASLPEGCNAAINQYVDKINVFLSDRFDIYTALQAIRSYDEAWLQSRIQSNYLKSRQAIGKQLPQLLRMYEL